MDMNKDKTDALSNLEWHLSLEGKLANASFRNIWAYKIILNNMADLLKIVDPERMDENVEYFRKKRDEAKQKWHKMYYHNKIRNIFKGAEALIINMTEEDAFFFGIRKDDVSELLRKKRPEYEVDTYRSKILTKI